MQMQGFTMQKTDSEESEVGESCQLLELYNSDQ